MDTEEKPARPVENQVDPPASETKEAGLTFLEEENKRLKRENNFLRHHYDALVLSTTRSKSYLISKEKLLVALEEQKVKEITKYKEQAEAASKAKSSFLAFMSHEIRTPLNAVIGFTEILLHRNLSKDVREDVEKIYSSGTILMGLINNILDISKIESGNMELIPVEYMFSSMINDILQVNIIRIGVRPVVLELEMNETLPAKLRGDELRIKQILNNLLSNAIKYTREGKVTLQIDWKQAQEEENTAILTFKIMDTGEGIQEKDIQRLFSQYSQFDAETHRNIEGSGLGLSITKNLVELMDGTIDVTSVYGSGSVFTVVIKQGIVDRSPIGKETIKNLQRFRQDGNVQVHKNIVRKSMSAARILVVDDVALNLEVVKGLTRPYGLTVDGVKSGQEAIDLIRGGTPHYDLIFMDHMMPVMDGIETTRIIRSMDSKYAKKTPIIALTANAMAGEMNMFFSSGFDDYLSKPVVIQKLNKILEKWIPSEKQIRKNIPDKKRPLNWEDLSEEDLVRLLGNETAGQIPEIPGVDILKGMHNTGGSLKGYRLILSIYYENTKSTIKQIQAALEKQDYPLYTTWVHAIKGSSRTIGAVRLGEIAAELEEAGRQEDLSLMETKTGMLIAETEELLDQITLALDTNPDESGEAHIIPKFETLKAALINNDYTTVNREIEWLSSLHLDKTTRELLDSIEKDVLLYEFEKATARL
ncbi:MAG: response regulator [Treponema sp.]|jgi:signal transduction histidine kinase/CheY-like chemotaxis protein|nr:response regulator [Treponema sp.]